MNGCIPDAVLLINREAKANAGEDSFCYCFGKEAGLVGVFDGCGGLGAQRHDFYSGKTEAYMASRLCSGAFFDSFLASFPGKDNVGDAAERYCAVAGTATAQVLSEFQPKQSGDGLRIKGSMVRTLPSTVSAALIQRAPSGVYMICPIWAGDSRTYLLTQDGLAQLTVDDTTVPDPMDNLYEDGILRNILCADKTPRLHISKISVKEPFCVFAATDGCFGYFSTPMEFEGVLLETLLISRSVSEWEEYLAEKIGRVAGDDYTLSMGIYGFSTFRAIQDCFAERYSSMQHAYLNTLKTLPNTDRATRQKMWEKYRLQYERHLKEV